MKNIPTMTTTRTMIARLVAISNPLLSLIRRIFMLRSLALFRGPLLGGRLLLLRASR